jgi:nitrite reductase (NO-forming)
MDQLVLGVTALIIFQIIILFMPINNHISGWQSHDQQTISLRTTLLSQPNNNNTIKKFILIADENIVKISPDNALHPGGILYRAMTFNGTIPGPIIVVNQGETFQITLVNKGELVHSLDLHGIEGPSQALAIVRPGESKTWQVKAENPGVFMYHCDGDNLNGIWDHIASGMYGGMIVHPKYEKPAKEFYVVFGEIYNTVGGGLFQGALSTTNSTTTAPTKTIASATIERTAPAQENQDKIGSFDMNKFIENKPDLILTNGMAYKYMPSFGSLSKIVLNNDAEIFKVKPGELTRWYIVNAGPRGSLSLNFASAMISSVGHSSNNYTDNKQLIDAITRSHFESPSGSKIYEVSIPPGSAESVEVVFPEQGFYVGNDHDIGRFLQGAGFVVDATNTNSTSDEHLKENINPNTQLR